MIKEAREEITCAEKMLAMMNLNSAIGFEAANHYYFSKGSLCEKIVNCYDIIKKCNKLFGHYLDCEAHTDVWRELFPTANQTNEK